MGTLTIQPSAKDTYLRQGYPTTNYGSSPTLAIRDRSTYTERAILEFDLSGLPSDAEVTSATLSLYYFDKNYTPDGKTVWAYKLTRTDWVELQATWNIYKTGSNWTTAGGDYITSSPAGGSTTVPANYGWMSWNVLAIVLDALNGSNPAEFLLRHETEGLSSGYSSISLYSRDYSNTSLRPKLVIEYTLPGITIYPPGLQVVIAYGTPALRYPQTISPPGYQQAIAYGTPSLLRPQTIYPPGHQQVIAYGTPSLLKYVWHAILDGRYSTGTLEVNRAYVIGRDQYGNPVYGTAVDSTELGLVGERLDFQQELAIPTTAQAQEVANAILSKMGLTGKSGVILIPPNCGQELFDVVQVTDSRGNQSAAKYRVVGLRFEYNPRQARYHHRLILGAP